MKNMVFWIAPGHCIDKQHAHKQTETNKHTDGVKMGLHIKESGKLIRIYMSIILAMKPHIWVSMLTGWNEYA